MSEYWLISAPGNTTCQQTWETMNNLAHKQYNLSDNYKFHIPDFKIGTLDQLVSLSDDLAKLDNFVNEVAHKIAQYLGEVLEGKKESLQESLKASNTDLATYITKFQWDMSKYSIKQSLRNIADTIRKQISQIDAEMKTKSTAYNNLHKSLLKIEKNKSLSLLTRNLAELVKKEHFVLDSMYLTTLLVIVPRSSFTIWNNNYENLSDMIVPRSSQLLFQDQEHGLFTVTLFKKVVNRFKEQAIKQKFLVRDFIYNEEELAAGKNEITKLATEKTKQFISLFLWLKVTFSETFCAWIHIKALRIFVESVLRYGLPVNFQAMLVHPHKNSEKRLRDLLYQLYAHLDTTVQQESNQQSGNYNIDIPGLCYGEKEYYPYVYFKINIDMLGSKKSSKCVNMTCSEF